MTLETLQAAIRNAIAPMQRRVRLMISRAVVELVDDSLKCQGLQVSLLAGEVQSDVEHFQPYGFTSHPLPGAEALFLAIGGNRSGGVVICAQNRAHRLTDLAQGEAALYTHEGAKVVLRLGRKIEVDAADLRLGDPAATRGAARNGDTVRVTIPIGTTLGTNGGGPIITTLPIIVDGVITSGSSRVKVADE